jgi:hypothetical protein
MAKLMLEMGSNLALYKGHPDELIEQEVNARVMSPEAMDRLTENIRKEHRLEQLPFAVVRDGDKHELISGHHRKRGAKGAKLDEIYWLADTRTDLARGTVVAKQIAHNTLQGEDDKATLKELYAELDTVDAKIESFLQPKDFDDVSQLEPAEAVDLSLDIDLKSMTLVFTPAVLESLDRIEAWANGHVEEATDLVGVIPLDMLARVRAVMLNVAKVEDVRSLGTVFARMCEIVEAHIAASDTKALPKAS